MTDQERQLRRRDRVRIGAILALCLAGAVPVVAAFAASPAPAADPAATATASTQPDASHKPGKDGSGNGPGAFGGFGFGGRGGFGGGNGHADRGGFGIGRGGIEITAIAGSSLSLKTDDGWTRTVVVTADTAIRKGGQTIKVADLSVGDKIRLSQKRNDDGSYAITAIDVPTPVTAGEVTAVDATSLTIKRRDGTSQTIKLNGTTTYKLGRDAGSKTDVTVGSRVRISGAESGSTFTALTVDVDLTAVGGEVTKVTATAITVKGRDGKSVVIHVATDTKIQIFGKKDAKATDIAVGDRIVAVGVSRADGSLDAQGIGGGHGHGLGGPKPTVKPAA